jgi:cytochrome b
MQNPPNSRVRVWDLPTRLAHWSLLLLVLFSWWSAETHNMDYHRYSGYALLGVLVFRLYWGVFGSSTARFAEFVKRPSTIIAYLRGDRSAASVGHNPLGALSVLTLLGLLIAQVTLGLFTVDVDGLESGPLSNLVSFETGRACAEVHEVVFNLLLAMIALHIAAITFYRIAKKEDLVKPMIVGWRSTVASLEPAKAAPWWSAVVGVIVAAIVVWWITK